MIATGQYFPVVVFITLYKVIPWFESVDENITCDHSNERATLSGSEDVALKGISKCFQITAKITKASNLKKQPEYQ